MLRFHLDEHVDHAIARGLRLRQIDVTTTTDAGLLGASDEEHLKFARRTTRILVTSDADFLRLIAQGIEHSGIIFLSSGDSRIGDVIRLLTLMSDCLTEKDFSNQVEYL